jgi:hypothetical protein
MKGSWGGRRPILKYLLAAFCVLVAAGCTPVEIARMQCQQGNQAACIDYATFSQAGMPGTAGGYVVQQRAATEAAIQNQEIQKEQIQQQAQQKQQESTQPAVPPPASGI